MGIHLAIILSTSQKVSKYYEHLRKEYGPVAGYIKYPTILKNCSMHNMCSPSYSYYVGQKPHIMVTDLDMLKQIMVKDFQNFMDHEVG